MAFREINFETADGGRVFGNVYGGGDRAVVLAHGAVFNKESWDPLARRLSEKNYCVLAIDFRGYGKSVAGSNKDALYEDVLAAVRYVRQQGAKDVSVIGGSMGGKASALAAVSAKEGEIDRLVLLSPVPINTPELIKSSKLFIASKAERLMPQIKAQYEKATGMKKFVLLEGDAHAQHIFKTDQGEKLTHIILEFLEGKTLH